MKNEMKIFLTKLFFTITSVIILYYIFSPYERCKRMDNSEFHILVNEGQGIWNQKLQDQYCKRKYILGKW